MQNLFVLECVELSSVASVEVVFLSVQLKIANTLWSKRCVIVNDDSHVVYKKNRMSTEKEDNGSV